MPSLQLSHGSVKVFGARGKWILYVIILWKHCEKSVAPKACRCLPCLAEGWTPAVPVTGGAIIWSITWASAFSSLLIVFMKKMWKFLLKISEQLELYIFGSSSGLEFCQKSTGVVLKLQSSLNFSLGKRHIFTILESNFLGYTLYWLWCNHETTHLFFSPTCEFWPCLIVCFSWREMLTLRITETAF